MFELANVALPGVGEEGLAGVGGEAEVAAVGGAGFGEEVFGEEYDVVAALAEGGEDEGDHVEAVEEVFAEALGADLAAYMGGLYGFLAGSIGVVAGLVLLTVVKGGF